MTPIEALKSSETNLVRQINSLSGVISHVGTGTLTSALATLHAEVDAARIRLESAANKMLRQITDLVAFAQGIVAMDATGVVAETMPSTPTASPAASGEAATTLPRPEVAKALAEPGEEHCLDCGALVLPRQECRRCRELIEDDRRSRTPDSGLDPSELEDQPEEVERNRQIGDCGVFGPVPYYRDTGELVPSISNGEPYHDAGDKDVLLGVGTGAEAVPDVPQPSRNGKHRAKRKGGKS